MNDGMVSSRVSRAIRVGCGARQLFSCTRSGEEALYVPERAAAGWPGVATHRCVANVTAHSDAGAPPGSFVWQAGRFTSHSPSNPFRGNSTGGALQGGFRERPGPRISGRRLFELVLVVLRTKLPTSK